jgi:hypothetical protein
MRRTWLSKIAAVGVVTLAVAGAGCAADPSPSGETDVARAFVRQITAEDLSTHVEITGTVRIGTIDGSFVGAMDLVGGDSAFRMDGDVGGSTSSQESITVDGVTYQRDREGPWVRETDPQAEDVGGWLTALSTIEDVGVERIDGEDLHHLRPAEEPSPAALGFGDADVRYTDVSVDFFADDRGTPRMMTISSRGGGRGRAARGDGAPVPVRGLRRAGGGPTGCVDDVRVRVRLTIAHPSGWTETSKPDADVLRGPGGRPEVYLAVNDVPDGLTEDDVPEAAVRGMERQFGTRSNTIEFYEVDGSNGLLAELRPESGGETLHVLYFVGPHDGRIYEVIWVGPLGIPDDNRATFEDMLGTYTWPR